MKKPMGNMIKNEVQYAGFWKRAVAGLIDLVILHFVVYFISLAGTLILIEMLTGYYSESERTFEFYRNVFLPPFFLYSFIVAIICAVFITSIWQATPGKRVMKVYVVDLVGNKLSYTRAIIRTLLPLSVVFIFSFVIFTLLSDLEYKLHNVDDINNQNIESLLPKTYGKFSGTEDISFIIILTIVNLHDSHSDNTENEKTLDEEIENKAFDKESVDIDKVVNKMNSIYKNDDYAELFKSILDEFLSLSNEKQIYTKRKILSVWAGEYLRDISYLIIIVTLILFAVLFLWYVIAAFTKEKTTMHDIFAKTRVIKGRP